MSIFGTCLSIEDIRQEKAELEAMGINHGVIMDDGEVENYDDLPEDMLDAPIVYQGSHILPSDNDRRGGSIDVASIPSFIERDGRDDIGPGDLKDWLRLSVHSEDSDLRRKRYPYGDEEDFEPYEIDEPYVPGGDATVILTRQQVERLRDTLTNWLERSPDEW